MEKIYQKNPYIREIRANIINKEYSNGKFYIMLDRTIFYPHMSGGQPKDLGKINDINVIDVYENDNNIVHVLNENIIEKEVTLNIDWKTRFDHMQQHTGQHILSAAFFKLFNGETSSFHLGSEYVNIDINISNITQEDITKVEKFANQIVFSNFDIDTYIVDEKDLTKIPLRKSPKVDTNIRIVEIDNIDYSPCSGTHTRTTGEIGIIKIRKFEKYKGMTRIEFVCGSRALYDYTWKNNQINSISSLLSCKDIESFEAANRLYDENKNFIKNIREYKDELLIYKSKELYDNGIVFGNNKIVKKIFDNHDFKDIRFLASNIVKTKNTIVIFGMKNNEKCQFVIARSSNIDMNLKNIFDSIIPIINGNGGGNNQIVQGGSTETNNFNLCLDEALNIIKEIIK